MYVPYITSDARVVSFHLGSKLEAPSQALGDDRDCYGAGPITATEIYCVDSSASPSGVMGTASSSEASIVTTNALVASDPSTTGMAGASMPANTGTGSGSVYRGQRR